MMIGTPLTSHAKRLMLLGAGELGKEVTIEAQRLGVEVIAVDRYPNAPAMQVAHRSHVIDMLDRKALAMVLPLKTLTSWSLKLRLLQPTISWRLKSSIR